MNRLTTREVAARLNGISEQRVRQIANELGLVPERIGKALFWTTDDLRRMKRRNMRRGPVKKNGK